MRVYLVDGSNAVRRGGYDPRFPEMEDARTEEWVSRIDRLAGASAGRIRVEVFFDGPRRPLGVRVDAVQVRFPMSGSADDMILGSVRVLAREGRGAVVVTEDGGLADDVRREGARTLGFADFEARLRTGRC
ncbi:MAG: hypothetical protein WC969_10130 [Elusimicrobiota bacterium]